jgi:hypothetical protein
VSLPGGPSAEGAGRPLEGLRQLQRLLESLHGVEAAEPVEQFLVGAEEKQRLAPGQSDDEALLLRGSLELGELDVGLFLSDEVLGQLSCAHDAPWTSRRLRGFCAAAEGVSHFVYLCHRARALRPVSLLELEAQAELDKYLCVLLQLWATGRRAVSGELRRRLFSGWSERPGLSAQERERYRLASALAAAAARVLEARYVVQGRLEQLLREVRRLYRLGGGEKLSAFAAGREAWAA